MYMYMHVRMYLYVYLYMHIYTKTCIRTLFLPSVLAAERHGVWIGAGSARHGFPDPKLGLGFRVSGLGFRGLGV